MPSLRSALSTVFLTTAGCQAAATIADKRVKALKSPGFALAFDRTNQRFHGFYGFDATKYLDVPFDQFWKAPTGCTGDEPIDIAALQPLKPVRSAEEPDLKHNQK